MLCTDVLQCQLKTYKRHALVGNIKRHALGGTGRVTLHVIVMGLVSEKGSGKQVSGCVIIVL